MGLKVHQPGLFDPEGPTGLLDAGRRERLIVLVAALIGQAAAGRNPDRKEAGDEQDHV